MMVLRKRNNIVKYRSQLFSQYMDIKDPSSWCCSCKINLWKKEIEVTPNFTFYYLAKQPQSWTSFMNSANWVGYTILFTHSSDDQSYNLMPPKLFASILLWITTLSSIHIDRVIMPWQIQLLLYEGTSEKQILSDIVFHTLDWNDFVILCLDEK